MCLKEWTINITILECKYVDITNKRASEKTINITILECKYF